MTDSPDYLDSDLAELIGELRPGGVQSNLYVRGRQPARVFPEEGYMCWKERWYHGTGVLPDGSTFPTE